MSPLHQAAARYERALQELLAAKNDLRVLIKEMNNSALGHHTELSPAERIGQTSPRIVLIQETVAAHYQTTVFRLLSHNKSARNIEPRHVAMAIARNLTKFTQAEIGDAFLRDHSTIINACRSVSERCVTEPVYKKRFEALTAQCADALKGLEAA